MIQKKQKNEKNKIEEEHNTFQEYWTKMAGRVDEIGHFDFPRRKDQTKMANRLDEGVRTESTILIFKGGQRWRTDQTKAYGRKAKF